MKDTVESKKLVTHETQGCLVVSIQEEMTQLAAQQFQTSLLNQVRAQQVIGVIIDLSGVQIIDSILWQIFSKTVLMLKMLGFPSVLTGLNPGVVVSIIDQELTVDNITTSMNLEDAVDILTAPVKTVEQAQWIENSHLQVDGQELSHDPC